MIIEPLRAAPLFELTDIVTLPLPVPLVGDTVTQDRLFDVVQEQFELDVITETVLVPPLEEKLPLLGDML